VKSEQSIVDILFTYAAFPEEPRNRTAGPDPAWRVNLES
jgi:hypothetical protein